MGNLPDFSNYERGVRMARPVYRGDAPTATAKLKEAFWQLLGEMNYSRITVKKLTDAAGLNPNTFYYHFATMDDLAGAALEEVQLSELPPLLMDRFLHGSAPNGDPDSAGLEERWQKIRLFLRSDSTVLQQLVYDLLEAYWLEAIGVSKGELTREEYLDLTFLLNGAVSVIRLQGREYDLSFLQTLPDRPLGQGVLQTLQDLMVKYHGQ